MGRIVYTKIPEKVSYTRI